MKQFKQVYGINLSKNKMNEIIFIFVSLEVIFAFSYLGYMDFHSVSTTTLHVLVIVAAMMFGIHGAVPVAIVFALTSMWAGTMATNLTDQIFSPWISGNPIGSIILGIIRLLFAVISSSIFRFYFSKERKYQYLHISAIAIFTTALYSLITFGGIYFFFPKTYEQMVQNFNNLPAIRDFSFYLVAVIGVCLAYYVFSNEKVKSYLTILCSSENSKKNSKTHQTLSFYLAEAMAAILGILVALYLWKNFRKEFYIGQVVLPNHIKQFLQFHLLQFYLAFASVIAILGIVVKWISEYNTIIRVQAEKDTAELRRLRREQEITAQLKEKNLQLEKQQEQLTIAIEQANQANHAKSVFLNNMSHDIRTPMNAIMGFTELATKHLNNQSQVLEYLKKISSSSQHLLSLINDVLDMSRIESGKIQLEEKEVHLPDVIQNLKTIIQPDVTAKNLNLYVDTFHVINEDVITDSLRFNQALLNILSNAIKYTPNGGTITMQMFQNPTSKIGYANYEFIIKDTGIGMSKEFQEHIFEEFSREETTTVNQIQGTGLGMAITKSIVDLMGGEIHVSSQQGKGSEFTIQLQFKINENKQFNHKIKSLIGRKVLVVDKDIHTCLSICTMFKQMGMIPEYATSGKEAITKTKYAIKQNDAFHTYIIDCSLTDIKQVEMIKQIHQFIIHPTIILTAYDFTDIEEEVRNIGVTSFCSKPIFLSDLQRSLTNQFQHDKKETNQEKQTSNFRGKKILLVEDNELNKEIAYTILTERGFIVSVASNGEEAVNMVKQMEHGQYDLILMDIQMPKMDGYAATQKIRALEDPEKATIPIIAMTANAFEEDKKKALDAGMNSHISKPVNVDLLEKKLTEILNKNHTL